MASHPASAGPKLRWGRALIAALVAEVALIVVVAIPIYEATADPTPLLNLITPPAALIVFIPAGYWTARPARETALLNGVLPGVIGIALYLVLSALGGRFGADLTPAYILAHVLKIVGGAIGGWFASRRFPPAPAA